MPRHRLALEADHYRLPAATAPTITPGSFQLCPNCVTVGCSPAQLQAMSDLYKAAFEQACDAARSSHPGEILFTIWN